MERLEYDIGVIARPSFERDDSYRKSVTKFIEVLEGFSRSISLFSGEFIHEDVDRVEQFDFGDGSYTGLGPIDHILLQVDICLKMVAQKEKFDLLFLHKGAMSYALPVLVSRLLGIPVTVIKIGAFHGERANSSVFSPVQRFMESFTFRYSSSVVVFSSGEKRKVPNDDVYVSYSEYCDFSRFDKRTELKERRYDIGFVGRFNETKNVVNVAKAVEKIVDRDTGARAILVGDGPLYPGVEESLNGTDGVDTLGWVDNEELPEVLNEIKVLLLPSRAEGLPTSVIEGMACGDVVLVSRVGSLTDIIEDEENGFFLDGKDCTDICEKYQEISRRDDLDKISGEARVYAESRFSLERVRKQFMEITRANIEGRRDREILDNNQGKSG